MPKNNLIYKQNTYSQITENRQLLLRHMPASLKETLVSALNQPYEELYEEEATGDVLLEETLEKILRSFQESHQLLGQLRYVWMALTLATIVEPTVKYYQPDNQIPEKIIGHLKSWFLKTFMEMTNMRNRAHSTFENINADSRIKSADFQCLLSMQKISSFQILSEALDVYANAIQVMDLHHSLQALLNILDDCLEGYAIFPGSYGRRELFNWWLVDVVPSCWYFLPPTSVDLPLKDSDKGLALSRLEETSSVIWSLIIRAAIQASGKGSRDPQLSFQSNMLPAFRGDVRVQIQNKYSQTTFKQSYFKQPYFK